jgi:hypothetical protein
MQRRVPIRYVLVSSSPREESFIAELFLLFLIGIRMQKIMPITIQSGLMCE